MAEKGRRMGKKELIQEIMQATGVGGETVRSVLDAAFVALGEAIEDAERVAWPGFGVFTVRERAPRAGRNPQTGEVITIAARRTVAFKPAAALKERL